MIEEIASEYDEMSVSEPEQTKHVHGERRMPITSYACDIMNPMRNMSALPYLHAALSPHFHSRTGKHPYCG